MLYGNEVVHLRYQAVKQESPSRHTQKRAASGIKNSKNILRVFKLFTKYSQVKMPNLYVPQWLVIGFYLSQGLLFIIK